MTPIGGVSTFPADLMVWEKPLAKEAYGNA